MTRRRHFHGYSLALIPWLFLEPVVTRCVTEVRGVIRSQRLARK